MYWVALHMILVQTDNIVYVSINNKFELRQRNSKHTLQVNVKAKSQIKVFLYLPYF